MTDTTCGVNRNIWEILDPRKKAHHKLAVKIRKARERLAKAEATYDKTRKLAIDELDRLNAANGTECRNLSLYELAADGTKAVKIEVKRQVPRKLDQSEARAGVGYLRKYLQDISADTGDERAIIEQLLSSLLDIGSHMTPGPEMMRFLAGDYADHRLKLAKEHLSRAITYDREVDRVYVYSRDETGQWARA